jgi:uncharacterized protein YcbX
VRISELWRYPVKSLRGERCEQVHVDARGVEGDRRYALVDADGKIGSHKSTRRFVRMKGLFDLAGRQVDGSTRVVFTDGSMLDAGDPLMGSALSEHVGQRVTLNAEAAISHQDAGALHIVTTASLRWLRERVPSVDVRRFRPNVVVEVEGTGLLERDWVGRKVTLGDVELTITEATERCVMTTLAQAELPKDPAILRAIAQEASACFGVYATVVRPGLLRQGDAVSAET